LQKYRKSASVILSLSKNNSNSNSYSTLRQAQGDISGLLQEPHKFLVSHFSIFNSRKGFTLLELLIVLFLFTLMITLSSVFFVNTLPSSRLNATAREISGTIRHARALAQIHSQRQTVTIDLDAKQYGVDGRGLRSIPSDVNIRVADTFSGDVYAGKYHIVANTTGTVNGGAIVLWNKKRTVTIHPDPIVGAVVIK